jgi:ribonuclease HII
MTLRLGIDEAGRGCVLGPMMYAGCLVREADEPSLTAAGVRDSKKLTAKKRDALRALVESTAVGFALVPFSPAELDATSLNELGKRALVSLTARFRPDVLVFDAPVPPLQIPGYIQDLRDRLAAAGLPRDLAIVGENGADDRYACCAAASILAKTERDAVLAALEAEAGRPIGSGYPGDPKTKRFLEESFDAERGFPPMVRTKWETARRIVAARAQGSLFPG